MLQRPIALVGFMGAGTAQIGHSLAASLGLPLEDVDRQIEHHAGMSLSALQLSQGEALRRQHESELLTSALTRSPPSIIVLGYGALRAPGAAQGVRRHAQLIYIQRPLDILHRGLVHDVAQHPDRYPEWVLAGAPRTAAGLTSLFALYEPGYAQAEITHASAQEHPQRVADALIRRLQLLES